MFSVNKLNTLVLILHALLLVILTWANVDTPKCHNPLDLTTSLLNSKPAVPNTQHSKLKCSYPPLSKQNIMPLFGKVLSMPDLNKGYYDAFSGMVDSFLPAK